MVAGAGPRWGRGAVATASVEVARRSAGARSLLFAIGAALLFAASIGVFAARLDGKGGALMLVATLVALAAFLVAAPTLVVMSMVDGLRAAFGTGGGRAAGWAGIVLSLVLLGLGALIVLAAYEGLGRVP